MRRAAIYMYDTHAISIKGVIEYTGTNSEAPEVFTSAYCPDYTASITPQLFQYAVQSFSSTV